MSITMDPRPESTGPAATRRSTVATVLRDGGLHVAVALWVIACVGLVLLTDGPLPVQRTGEAVDAVTEVVDAQLNLVVALVLVAVALLVTARRPRVDLAARAPERRVAAVETAALLAYGGAVTLGGLVIGRLAGDHAISLHLPGTIHGLHGDTLAAGWVALWAGYNLVMWAVIPFAVMRARGYTLTQLNLRSVNVRGDVVLIVVILVLESAIELTLVSGDLFSLSPATLALGIPLAFAVNMLGTVLPVMIFIYAILLPRFARLTGSTTTTVLLGGAAYALIHLFESWAVWTSVGAGLTTVILLFFQYFGPGVIKSVLTVRTGNAWVHVWAYHAVAPHVTLDTVNVLDSLDLR